MKIMIGLKRLWLNKYRMVRFQDKYRVQTARLRNWDYRLNGLYFVTICTKDKKYFFGEIQNDIMGLSEIGLLVYRYWLEIPQHFPFVKLDKFVIMPNHVHGIIIVDKCDLETPGSGVSTPCRNYQRGQGYCVPSSLSGGKNEKWQPASLGVIINQYKRICTIKARKILPDFAWQPRYYDHIIRDEKSYNKIIDYIINNSTRWDVDSLNFRNNS